MGSEDGHDRPMSNFEEAARRFAETMGEASDAMQRFADANHPEAVVRGVPLDVRRRAKELWEEHPDLGLLDVLVMAEREPHG